MEDGWCPLCRDTTDGECIHWEDRITTPRPRRTIMKLRDVIAGLLDGPDANGDDKCGLSQEQWDERVAEAREALEECRQ